MIRSSTICFGLDEKDSPMAKRPKSAFDNGASSNEESKISQIFKNQKALLSEDPEEVKILFIPQAQGKTFFRSTHPEVSNTEFPSSEGVKVEPAVEGENPQFSKIGKGKISKTVSWALNPETFIIPNREELDCSDLWWDDLKSRGLEKMLERNDESELRDFSDSMLSLKGVVPDEKLQRFTYEALTASITVEQTESAYENDEIDPDNVF